MVFVKGIIIFKFHDKKITKISWQFRLEKYSQKFSNAYHLIILLTV